MAEVLPFVQRHEIVSLRLVPSFPVRPLEDAGLQSGLEPRTLDQIQTRALLEAVNREIRQYGEREVPYFTVRRKVDNPSPR